MFKLDLFENERAHEKIYYVCILFLFFRKESSRVRLCILFVGILEHAKNELSFKKPQT